MPVDTYLPCVYHDHGDVIPTPILDGVAVTDPIDFDLFVASLRAITRSDAIHLVRVMPHKVQPTEVVQPWEFISRLNDWAAGDGRPHYECCDR